MTSSGSVIKDEEGDREDYDDDEFSEWGDDIGRPGVRWG